MLAENSSKGQSLDGEDHHSFKNILAVLGCLSSSLLSSYLLHNPYGSYVPIILIAIFEWHRSFPRQRRSYYGLCRLLLFLLVITLWVVFVLRLSVQIVAFLMGYRHVVFDKVQHLFPYALIFTMFARRTHDMDIHDRRRYIIHLLYDLPAFVLVIAFKLLNHPLNSLCSQITEQCYLGCLPMPSDVQTLHNLGIECVVNMCAEYRGPRKTYEKYHIKQLHLPTVDSTAPSFKSIQKAVRFMNEAYTNHRKIFVHCKAGMGRSASIVYCHLIANEKLSPEAAIELMKEKRPEITSSIAHYAPVKQFLATLKNSSAH
jgi:atypical dual specificity phosphatase